VTDHKADVEAYMSGVISGEITVGKLVRQAVQRHLKDLKRAKKKDCPFYFDWDIVNHTIDFFPLLKHATGEFENQPFHLERWQKFLGAVLFGWRKKEDGLRRFRQAFLSVGRGNGKSPFAAALATKLWCADQPIEARAEVYTAATRKKQARIVWDEARRYVQKIPSLKKRVETYDSTLGTRMVLTSNESVMEVLEYSPQGHDGQVTHAFVLDELHALREQHRLLVDNLKTSMAKRRQPLGVYITTAGGDESTLWVSEYEYCLKVLDGIVPADDYFVLIYQLDEHDDIHDEANWPKANPNLDVSVKRDGLRSLSEKAKYDPDTKRIFRRYHCNLKTSSLTKAIPTELWAKGNRPLPPLAGLPCYGGLDIGWRDDLAAFVLVFPLKEVEITRYALKGWAWIPEGCERDLNLEPWATWIKDGQVLVTDGDVTDHKAIIKQIAKCQKHYDLRIVAFDMNNARAIGVEIENELGLPTFPMFQSAKKYNEPIREALRAMREGRIIHAGDPVLAWAASNLVTRADSDNCLKPAKDKSLEKIDPIVAFFMAFSECLFGEKDGEGPYAADGGGVVLF
jgi:phage terminase large subunit-like protein